VTYHRRNFAGPGDVGDIVGPGFMDLVGRAGMVTSPGARASSSSRSRIYTGGGLCQACAGYSLRGKSRGARPGIPHPPRDSAGNSKSMARRARDTPYVGKSRGARPGSVAWPPVSSGGAIPGGSISLGGGRDCRFKLHWPGTGNAQGCITVSLSTWVATPPSVYRCSITGREAGN
jgi:hypothetical protein